MRSGLWYAGAIVLLAAAQRAWPPVLMIRDLSPDLLVVLVCAIGLLRGPLSGYAAGFGAGLLAAAAQGGAFGAVLVSRMATGLAAGLLRERIFAERLVVAPVAAALATVVADLIQLAFAPPSQSFAQWLQELLIRVAYNAVCAPPLYLFVRAVDRRYPRRLAE